MNENDYRVSKGKLYLQNHLLNVNDTTLAVYETWEQCENGYYAHCVHQIKKSYENNPIVYVFNSYQQYTSCNWEGVLCGKSEYTIDTYGSINALYKDFLEYEKEDKSRNITRSLWYLGKEYYGQENANRIFTIDELNTAIESKFKGETDNPYNIKPCFFWLGSIDYDELESTNIIRYLGYCGQAR